MFDRATLLGLALLLAARLASAAETLGYQGIIQDPDGSPRNGQVEILVRLWSAPTGGSLLWSELHPSVPVVDGVFSLDLGSLNPALPGLLKSTSVDMWLGLSIDAEDLVPRQKLQSVARALRAGSVDDGAIGARSIGEVCLDGQVLVHSASGWACGTVSSGTACWDLDGNGACGIASEDLDGSGDCDALDCRGPRGDAGATGPAGPAGPEGPPNPNAANSDRLDSLDSLDFLRSTGKAADSNLLDGLDSTAFWRKSEGVNAATLDSIDSIGFSQTRKIFRIAAANTTVRILDLGGLRIDHQCTSSYDNEAIATTTTPAYFRSSHGNPRDPSDWASFPTVDTMSDTDHDVFVRIVYHPTSTAAGSVTVHWYAQERAATYCLIIGQAFYAP